MPSTSISITPNKFFVEKQVSIGQMIYSNQGDFSNKRDDRYSIATGKDPNYLLLSGSVDASESIERGNYTLVGGYLRTYVSGMSIAEGDGAVPTLQLYSLKNHYKITEGGMKYSRKTSAGTVALVNGSPNVTGTATDFAGADGFFGDYYYYANYQGGAYVWLGPAGSRERYEVSSITSDTVIVLTANYTGTTQATEQLQLDEDIGDNITSFVSTYTMPTVNFNEDFDGVGAELSTVTEFTREGASAVVKKGHPYLLNSQYDSWKYKFGGSVGVKEVRKMMEANTWYPYKASTTNGGVHTEGRTEAGLDAMTSSGGGYISAQSALGGGIVSRMIKNPNYGLLSYNPETHGIPGFKHGRLYLKQMTYAHPATAKKLQGYYILDRNGNRTDYLLSLNKGTADTALVHYDTIQTFNPDPENTVTSTNNNTIFDKVYSSMMFENPFTATTDVPIVNSTVELQSDVVKGGANAARLYHIWDYSPDNALIQKYFGRESSLNPQTAYMAKYNLPFPIIQDMSFSTRIGDRRTYMPYVSMDMNVAKLSASVLYDIQNYASAHATGSFINDPQTTYTTSAFQASNWGSSSTIRQKAMTFLRSVVVTFSNYKPLDTHTTLEDFLQYGFDNAYGSSQTNESIVGGVVLSRLGMDGANIDNDFIYAQALPIVREDYTMDYNEQWHNGNRTGAGSNRGFGLAKIVSGSGQGKLQQLVMKAANIDNTYSATNQNTPRVVKLPMNQFFNMKFYIDTLGEQTNTINSRNPYSGFPTSNGGVGMRCVFETDSMGEDSSSEDLYTDMPFLDLNFSVSGGNSVDIPGGETYAADGGKTPTFSYAGRFLSANEVTLKYPKHMIIWVQNYRFVDSSEAQFFYGDNAIIGTASGSAIEAEVYVDNVKGVDFYQDLKDVTAVGENIAPVVFPQGDTVDSPITVMESTTHDLTSFNTGPAQSPTAANTTIRTYSPASYWSLGFDSKQDLPLSGSATARRGYVLMNSFYQTAGSAIEHIIPDLYSGATLSLVDGDYANGLQNDLLGYELKGSPYANSATTVGSAYYDPAVGNNQYETTGGKDVATKICFGTGSSNNFLSTDGLTQKGFVQVNISDVGSFATITGITQANPAVVTAASHGFSDGDKVRIIGVVGMTEVNGGKYTVANKTTNTFELDGINSTTWSSYTSGGTVSIYVDNYFTQWGKRENALCSTKVTDVARGGNELTSYQLQLDNTNVLNPYNKDEQYILYQVGMPVSTTYYKILTLNGGLDAIEDNVVTFNETVATGAAAQAIGQETQLPYLYLSPYKYWININTQGDQNYKLRSYTGITLVNNNLSGASSSPSSITGSTFNEATYTFSNGNTSKIGLSAPYNSPWDFIFDTEGDTAVTLTADYGYGVYDTETRSGGFLSYINPTIATYNYMDIASLLTDKNVQDEGKFNLVLRQRPTAYHTSVELVGDEYNATNQLQYKPTYIYEYVDSTPVVSNFSVEPAYDLLSSDVNLYELTNENLNAVKFKWNIQDEDIWYKMIMVDSNGAIDNKYENAKLWIPCNEEPSDLIVKPTINWYNNNTTTSGTATVGANVRSYIDGIQGYSPFLSGNALGTASISVPNSSNNSFHGLTEYTFSVHVTFDSSMKGTACKILGKGQPVSNYIDLQKNGDDVITYRHESSTGTGATITGSHVVTCDGKTPYSIIVTYRYQSAAGPDTSVYVDGVLDSYEQDSAGALNNTDAFELAPFSTAGPYFKGRIEEFVLYDKQYIVPDGDEYIFNAADLTDETGGKTNIWSAKLFAFDYHNIRGKINKLVASSQNISWRTTPV